VLGNLFETEHLTLRHSCPLSPPSTLCHWCRHCA